MDVSLGLSAGKSSDERRPVPVGKQLAGIFESGWHKTKEDGCMPTERFYRLPKEKAEIIRQAAIREFKRVPPEEASINKIIQTAEISRGSFYTYFEDKYDLLKWLMGDFIGCYRRFYIDELKVNGGDLWDVFERVLDYSIRWVDEQGLVEIIGNMMKSTYFSEQMTNGNGPVKNCKIDEENKNYAEELYSLVSPSSCTLKQEDFSELMKMHVATLIFSLKAHYTKARNLEEIKDSYHRCMNLMRYGACPGRDNKEV